MKRTSITIALLALSISPCCSQTLNGSVQKQGEQVNEQQSARLSRDGLKGNVNQIEQEPQTPRSAPQEGLVKGNQFQMEANHGESAMGVIGCKVNSLNGVVERILPGSDLMHYGILPGDRVAGYNRHGFIPGTNMVDESVGPVGSFMDMTFARGGQFVTINVRRTDARVFLPYAHETSPGYNHIEDAASQARRW